MRTGAAKTSTLRSVGPREARPWVAWRGHGNRSWHTPARDVAVVAFSTSAINVVPHQSRLLAEVSDLEPAVLGPVRHSLLTLSVTRGGRATQPEPTTPAATARPPSRARCCWKASRHLPAPQPRSLTRQDPNLTLFLVERYPGASASAELQQPAHLVRHSRKPRGTVQPPATRFDRSPRASTVAAFLQTPHGGSAPAPRPHPPRRRKTGIAPGGFVSSLEVSHHGSQPL